MNNRLEGLVENSRVKDKVRDYRVRVDGAVRKSGYAFSQVGVPLVEYGFLGTLGYMASRGAVRYIEKRKLRRE